MATAVWIGNPAGSIDLKGGRVQGGTAAGKVWREFMYPYLEDSPVIEFAEPDSSGKSSYIKDPWSKFVSKADATSGSSSSTKRSTSSGSSSRTTTTLSDDGGDTGGGTDGGDTGGGDTGGGDTDGGTATTTPVGG